MIGSTFCSAERHVLFVTLILFATGLSVATFANANTTGNDPIADVRVQLKWFHQFQFAGYYAALANGYFHDAGLNVTLIEGGPHINPTDEVLAGNADFGIGTSGLLISKSKGRPIIAVAAIFQHSPYILIAPQVPDINTLHDLKDRKVMVEPYAEELLAYLHYEGVDPDSLNMIEHSGNPLDLYNDSDIAAMTAYTSTEPFILAEAGKPFRVFDPKVAGIDFYGDTLFTTEEYAAMHNDRVVAFHDALIKGWRYALRNQDEIIDLILQEYNHHPGRANLRHEADDIRRLLIPDLIEIGYMNPDRWQHIADEFGAAGLMAREVDIDSFMFEPHQPRDWTWVGYVFVFTVLVVILFSAILAKFYTLNRSLQAEIRQRITLEKELHKRAITDFITGLLNRRGFLEALETEFARAERNHTPLSLIELDLDHFKQINDQYGHAAGDHALTLIADICRDAIRTIDVIGRVGGEEFMIALPDTNVDDAAAVANRILDAIESTPLVLDDGQAVSITASIGVAMRRTDESASSLMSRADNAMYAAKDLGRNKVSIYRDGA